MWENTKPASSIVEQPFKIPFAAAIIIVVNPQKAELVQEFLARAVTTLQSHLRCGSWREVKLVLRFLACLQGVLGGDGVFPILDELFSRAVDLQTASSEDVSIISGKVYAELTLMSLEFGFGACEDHPTHNPLCYGFFCNRLRRAC